MTLYLISEIVIEDARGVNVKDVVNAMEKKSDEIAINVTEIIEIDVKIEKNVKGKETTRRWCGKKMGK